MPRIPLSIAILALLTALAPAQIVERLFDVGLLTGQEQAPRADLAMPLAALLADEDFEDEGMRSRPRGLDTAQLAEIVRLGLGAGGADGGPEVEPRGNTLVVRGPAAVLDRVPDLLRSIEEQLLLPSVVVVYRLPAGSSVEAGVLGAEAVQALLQSESGAPVLVGSQLIHHGGTRVIGRREQHRFVGDSDVEVASSSQIADPRVMRLDLGEEFVLQVTANPDGKRLISVSGGQSRLLGFSERQPAGEAIGRLRLPEVASDRIHGSAALGEGEAFVVGVAGGKHTRRWLVRLASAATPGASGQDGPRLLPLGLAAMKNFGRARLSASNGARALILGLAGAAERRTSVDDVLESMRDRVPAFWSSADSRLWALGASVQVQGPAAPADEIRQLLEKQLGEGTRNLSLDLAAVMVGPERAGDLWPGRAIDAEAAKKLAPSLQAGLRGAVTSICGDAFHLAAATERMHVGDLAVEIAEKASIVQPEPHASFAGIVWNGRLAALDEERSQLELDLVWAARPAAEPFVTAVGEIDQVRAPRATQRIALALGNGDWTVLTTGPVPGAGNDAVLVHLARVRR